MSRRRGYNPEYPGMRGEEIYPHTRGFGGFSDKDASKGFAYVPGIIARQDFDITSCSHRDQMCFRHPWAYKATFHLPEYLWSQALQVTDADGSLVTSEREGERKEGEPEPDTEGMRGEEEGNGTSQGSAVVNALEALEKIHWRDAVKNLCKAEMRHEYAVLVIWSSKDSDWQALEGAPKWQNPDAEYVQRVPGLSDVARLDWLSQTDINKGNKIPADHLDDEGWPEKFRYYYTDTKFTDIDAKRCLLVRTRPRDRTYKGIPFIEPGWDYLIWSYSMMDSFAWAVSKYGLTSLAVPTMGSPSTTREGEIETALEGQHKRGFVWYNEMAQKAPEFIRPFDTLDPKPLMDTYLSSYASAIGFPKLWVEGEKVGAVTGSEIDTRNVTARIKQLEALWQGLVWRLLAVVDPAVIELAQEYRILHQHEEQMSDIEKGQWWSQVAGAVPGLKEVMTVNDIRMDVLKKGPLKDGSGDESPNERSEREAELQKRSMSFEVRSPGGKDKGQQQNSQPRGEEATMHQYSPVIPRLEAMMPDYPWHIPLKKALREEGSLNAACRKLKISKNTWYKLREKYKEITGHDADF